MCPTHIVKGTRKVTFKVLLEQTEYLHDLKTFEVALKQFLSYKESITKPSNI